MDLVEKITHIIEPSLDSMGYDIVQVKLSEGERRRTLTVMAERKDAVNMGFDDCTEISRLVGALLEVEDPITTAYNLEVCSPGLDRPLMKQADYERFAGHEIKLETQVPMDGRKRFRGVLKGIDKGVVTLAMPEGEAAIAFSNIRSAKLVATEEKITKQLKKQKHK